MEQSRSQNTIDITNGAVRFMIDLGFAPLCEFRLKNSRRADLCAINEKGEIIIIEVKSSYEDFRVDNKWHEYIDYCDRFYFAIDKNFPQNAIPENIGIIIADKYGAQILREGFFQKLSPNRRKAVTLSLARQAAFANLLISKANN